MFKAPKALAAVGMSLLLANGASAGWLTWTGVGITVGGIVAAATPTGIGQLVGAVAGAVQVIVVGTDAVKTAIGSSETPQPPIAANPQPPAYVAGLTAFTQAIYQPIPLPGNAGDALAASTNIYISSANVLMTNFTNGASSLQLNADLAVMADNLNQVNDQYNLLGFVVTISQSDIINAQAQIATSGLPSSEVTFLQNAGFSASDILGFSNFVASTPTNLAVPTTTLGDLFQAASTATAVPEIDPAAGGSALSLVAGVLAMIEQRRRRAKPVA
jgi:hypothetical protein